MSEERGWRREMKMDKEREMGDRGVFRSELV